jgi:hypothetical protein
MSPSRWKSTVGWNKVVEIHRTVQPLFVGILFLPLDAQRLSDQDFTSMKKMSDDLSGLTDRPDPGEAYDSCPTTMERSFAFLMQCLHTFNKHQRCSMIRNTTMFGWESLSFLCSPSISVQTPQRPSTHLTPRRVAIDCRHFHVDHSFHG